MNEHSQHDPAAPPDDLVAYWERAVAGGRSTNIALVMAGTVYVILLAMLLTALPAVGSPASEPTTVSFPPFEPAPAEPKQPAE